MRNRSESREEFAYRVQISLFGTKLPLICSSHCNNQPSQLFTCSPLCWCWLGNGRHNGICFLLALWGAEGAHTLDRQTDRQADGPLFPRNKRVACSLLSCAIMMMKISMCGWKQGTQHGLGAREERVKIKAKFWELKPQKALNNYSFLPKYLHLSYP